MVVKVYRGKSLAMSFIALMVLGAMTRVGVDVNHGALTLGKVAEILPVFSRGVTDSYSKQMDVYDKTKAVHISPIKPSKNNSTAVVAPSLKRASLEVFMSAAYDYKLQTARTRSERLENLEAAKEAGARGGDDELISALTSARSYEDRAEKVLVDMGYGKGVASSDGEKIRVFVPRTLGIDDVTKLGEELSQATGLPLEHIIISQRFDGNQSR